MEFVREKALKIHMVMDMDKLHIYPKRKKP
jgi:hypothetical protein